VIASGNTVKHQRVTVIGLVESSYRILNNDDNLRKYSKAQTSHVDRPFRRYLSQLTLGDNLREYNKAQTNTVKLQRPTVISFIEGSYLNLSYGEISREYRIEAQTTHGDRPI
jgi:hypothetical protein